MPDLFTCVPHGLYLTCTSTYQKELPDQVVWTIAAQEGTGGERVAAALAAAAGVPSLDREALTEVAHAVAPQIGGVEDLERRVGGRLELVALSMALTAGAADAYRELELRRRLPELGRSVLAEAARQPCVILAPGAFAALGDHPGAVHVRLRAPLVWRVASFARERLVDHRCAEKAVRRADHREHAWVRSLYGADIDDAGAFTLVVDTSRLCRDRIVELLLAAAGARERATV
ncbi:MAG TPA: cytidylate kinase family protein [Gaiellaceae bacterium]